MRPTALIIAPDASTRRVIARSIRRGGRRVLRADGPDAARRVVAENRIDVALLDLSSLGEAGILLIPVLRQAGPQIRIILLTRPEQIPLSIRGMKLGAFDDVTMPLDLERFASLVDAAFDGSARPGGADRIHDSARFPRQE